MPKLTLWKCDHCNKQNVQTEIPNGWAVAVVDALPIKGKEYIWCFDCWVQFSGNCTKEDAKC